MNFCWAKAADELMSVLIILRAMVFCARASVTAALGFLIMVPRALLWNIFEVFVRHMVATGDVMRRIVYSNFSLFVSFLRYSAKAT